MVDYFKICYTAQYPDGKLLDPSKPYMEANILASTKKEAITKLIDELHGVKVSIVEDPTHLHMDEIK